MEQYIYLSYIASLLLLFTGIILLKRAYQNPSSSGFYQWFLRLTGIIPGFAGVIWGVYLQITNEGIDGLVIMSAWLVLQLGSVQILSLMKKFSS